MNFENPTNDPLLLEQHMFREITKTISYSFSIDVAFNVIRKYNRNITDNDLDFLICDNAIIPEDRKHIYRLAIRLGLNGDYYAALLLLVPQIEYLFREIAKMCGAVVTKYETDSVEQTKH